MDFKDMQGRRKRLFTHAVVLILACIVVTSYAKVYISATSSKPALACDVTCMAANPCYVDPSFTLAASCDFVLLPGNFGGRTIKINIQGGLVFSISQEDFSGAVSNFTLSVPALITPPGPHLSINNLEATQANFQISGFNQVSIINSTFDLTSAENTVTNLPGGSVIIASSQFNKADSLPAFNFPNTIINITQTVIYAPSSPLFSGPLDALLVFGSHFTVYSISGDISGQMTLFNSDLDVLSDLLNATLLSSGPANLSIITTSIHAPNPVKFATYSMKMPKLEIVQSIFGNIIFENVAVTNSLNVDQTRFTGAILSLIADTVSSSSSVTSNTFRRSKFASVANRAYIQMAPSGIDPVTTHFSGNTFSGPRPGSSCDLFLSLVIFDANTDLQVDAFCVEENVTINGHFALTSLADTPLVVAPYIQSTSSLAMWTFSSINISTSMLIRSPLTYLATNAHTGILLPPGGTTNFGLPPSVDIVWADPNFDPVIGAPYPLFTGLAAQAIPPPLPAATLNPFLNFTLFYSNSHSNLMYNISSFACAIDCDPIGSDACRRPNSCHCRSGFSGPTCTIATPCGPSPGPYFTCVLGQWVASSPIEDPAVVIPNVVAVINGNLTVTATLTFNGLDSALHVNGCIHLTGDVELHLTEQELIQLEHTQPQTGVHKELLTGGDSCSDSTNLATVPVAITSSSKCKKVKSTNASTPTSLSVLLRVDSSGCNKIGKIIAIVIPCVFGVVLVAAGVGAIIFWKSRKKQHTRASAAIRASAVL